MSEPIEALFCSTSEDEPAYTLSRADAERLFAAVGCDMSRHGFDDVLDRIEEITADD